MMRQLKLVFWAFGLSVLGTNAWADGMVQHAAAVPCCEAPFAGAYFGADLGYARQRVDINNESLGTEFKDNESGVTFGGYAGYNWQRCCSPVVFGVETDFNFINTSPTAFDIEPGIGPNAGLTEITSLKSRMDWFGTLRGRAGYTVHDDWLLYATGGLAYAQVDHTLSDNCVGCGNSNANLGPFEQSNKNTKVGWTVGGGAEYLHDSHWLLRAEALFVDLGSETHTYNVSGIDANTGLPASGTAVAKWDDQFWVARVGLAYKFGDPGCCVVPLK
jgi:outer membrane immunogenic protein